MNATCHSGLDICYLILNLLLAVSGRKDLIGIENTLRIKLLLYSFHEIEGHWVDLSVNVVTFFSTDAMLARERAIERQYQVKDLR